MLTTADFLIASKWAGISTLAFAALTILSFFLQWGLRFRLVGVTGFMGVLTGGLFALGLVPFTRTVVPDAVRYATVYDNGANLAVIVVPPTITETQLQATLRQAAGDLFSYGRMSRGGQEFLIRARTVIHPQPGVTEPLFLGQVKPLPPGAGETPLEIETYPKNLAKLAKLGTSKAAA